MLVGVRKVCLDTAMQFRTVYFRIERPQPPQDNQTSKYVDGQLDAPLPFDRAVGFILCNKLTRAHASPRPSYHCNYVCLSFYLCLSNLVSPGPHPTSSVLPRGVASWCLARPSCSFPSSMSIHHLWPTRSPSPPSTLDPPQHRIHDNGSPILHVSDERPRTEQSAHDPHHAVYSAHRLLLPSMRPPFASGTISSILNTARGQHWGYTEAQSAMSAVSATPACQPLCRVQCLHSTHIVASPTVSPH